MQKKYKNISGKDLFVRGYGLVKKGNEVKGAEQDFRNKKLFQEVLPVKKENKEEKEKVNK